MGLKKRVKGTFEKLVPISPEFYDTERDEDLVAPKNVLLPFNAFLLLSQWIAFIALMVYYSGPANYVKDTTIKTDYNFCLLYTSPSPRDKRQSRMPSSA